MKAEKDYTGKNIISLYNSQICRLCGEQNVKGYSLFCAQNDNEDFSIFINKYLPIKIRNDGKYPCWICGGCHLQVEATVQFFNLIEVGQRTLQELYELECKRIASIKPFKIEDLCNDETDENPTAPSTCDRFNDIPTNDSAQYSQKQEPISLPPSSENKSNPLVTNSAQISLLNIQKLRNPQSTETVKKKRGRPRKTDKNTENLSSTDEIKEQISISNASIVNDGTFRSRRRVIKPPLRYQEAVRGKEYEKVYQDMGIAEGNFENVSPVDDNCLISNENEDDGDNVIGFVQSGKGESLGDLIIIRNRMESIDGNLAEDHSRNRKYGSGSGKTRFMCDVCKISFIKENKFLEHRFSHKNVRFECNQCLQTFTNKNSLIEHQTNENHFGAGIIEEFGDSGTDTMMPAVSNSKEVQTDALPSSNPNDLVSSDLISNLFKDTQNSPQIVHQFSDQLIADNSSDIKKVLSNVNAPGKEPTLPQLPFTSNNLNNSHSELNTVTSTPQNVKSTDDHQITFKNDEPMNYQISNEQNEGRVYVCSKCNKHFASREGLKNHQKAHISVKPFKCQICGKGFKMKSIFIAHKSLHTGDKPFSCEKCGQKFAHKRSLRLHNVIHEDLKPFKCKQCGKGFTQFGNMQEHYRIHTGERPFSCHICNKQFRASSQCKTHIKRHQLERPLKCTKCEKRFVNNDELRMHLRRHNNIKPFVCDQCNKGFVELQALKKHYRIHTGEKPYSCTMCDRKFSDRSNLKKHQKVHLNKKEKYDLHAMNLNEENLQNYDDVDDIVDVKRNAANETEFIPENVETDPDNPEEIISRTLMAAADANTIGAIDCSLKDDEEQMHDWNLISDGDYHDNDDGISSDDILINNELILKTTSDYLQSFRDNSVICVTCQDPQNPGGKTTLFVVNNVQ